MRRLNQENEELRQRLVAGESRLAELQRSAAQQSAPQQLAPQQAPAPEQQSAFAPSGFDPNAMDPGNTNNLLQLARRLHEEHVREGMEKRDALIAEGHAAAARVVSEAEQGARSQLGALQQEKNELERKVEELRQFERDYRSKLRGYIEGQLRELESSNALTAAPAQAAVSAAPQQYGAPASSSYGQQQQPEYAAPAYGAAPSTEYPGFGAGN
ncbi:MAG: cell division protein [Gemmatimonadota bacterium]